MNEALNPSAQTLAKERLYICQPDGFTAFKCLREVTDDELALIKFERVVFQPVKLRPPVCPVNGAEFGDEPYWVRMPTRSDGKWLKYG